MQTTYFFGSNTPNGFVKANDEPLFANKVIILKGGAGCGKSTIIKKVHDIAKNSGYDSILYRCSSDTDSLDGIYIKSLNCAVVDGTPPHNVEATYPLTKHYMFNLLDKANINKIQPHYDFINKCIMCKKQYFTNAYCYLNSAYVIQHNINNIIKQNIDYDKLNEISNDIISKINTKSNEIKTTSMFCSALTNKGLIDFYNDNFYNYNKISLVCDFEIIANELLKIISNKISTKSKVTTLLNPLSPDLIEGLIINKTLISYKIHDKVSYDLNCAVFGLGDLDFDEDINIINKLVSKSIKSINYAHSTHMEIEKCYYDAMDWEDINNKTDKIISLIFA